MEFFVNEEDIIIARKYIQHYYHTGITENISSTTPINCLLNEIKQWIDTTHVHAYTAWLYIRLLLLFGFNRVPIDLFCDIFNRQYYMFMKRENNIWVPIDSTQFIDMYRALNNIQTCWRNNCLCRTVQCLYDIPETLE